MKTLIQKICIVMVVIAGTFAFGTTGASAAGGLNAAEQRAIAAAQQPFEYNGKTYVVNSSYISQATAKLSADNVDMSDAEANQYIAQFGGSHQELVEEGYCNEVSSGSGNDGTDASEKKSDSKKDNKKDKKNTDGSSKKSDDTESEHSTKTSSLNRIFLKKFLGAGKQQTDTTNEQQPENTATANPQETSAAENVWVDEEDKLNTVSTITADDVDYTYADKVDISYGSRQYDSEYDFLKDILHIKEIKTLWFCVLAAAILALVLQIVYIFTVKKRGHKKRKLRCAIAVYSGAVIACITILMIASLVVRCGFLNTSTVDRELMESDYFSGTVQTVREMAKKDLKAAGYDESLAKDIFKLSNIYITQKQCIKDVLKKGVNKQDFSNQKINELLKEKITNGSEKENQKLIEKLESDYKSAFSFKYGDAVYKCNKEFNAVFIGMLISMVLIFVIMFVMIFQMYEYKHKAVRVYAFAITIASVPAIAAGVFLKIAGVAAKVKISPVYYQDFLTKYLGWNINICIYMGLISLLIGISLFFVKNYLHRLYVE